MKNKHKVLFIDDELQGENSRMQLVQSLNMDDRLDVFPIHPVDLTNSINEHLIPNKYTLIIVDYKLSTHQNADGLTFENNGYSLTSLLKEKCPDTPVYLISQILTDDITMGEHYDKMLSHSLLTKSLGRDLLVHDCEDYTYIHSQRMQLDSIEKIINCLKVPDNSQDGFAKAIPLEFKSGLKSRLAIQPSEVIDQDSSYLRFSKWLNSTFITKTGPLISIYELAVLFGVNKDYLEASLMIDYQDDFCQFEYKGPFSRSNERRWWMQEAFDFAIKLSGAVSTSTPWREIPTALQIPEEHQSKCIVCHQNNPECIAFDIDDIKLEKRYPAHWSCVTLSQKHEELIGFDPIYILDEDQ